jgi:hypothetical protein
VNTDFLDQLAGQLKADKNAACRRAIERILAMLKKRCEEGKYENSTEAELDLRRFVGEQGTCQKSLLKKSREGMKREGVEKTGDNA